MKRGTKSSFLHKHHEFHLKIDLKGGGESRIPMPPQLWPLWPYFRIDPYFNPCYVLSHRHFPKGEVTIYQVATSHKCNFSNDTFLKVRFGHLRRRRLHGGGSERCG